MANPEHLQILQQGVEAWNQWRSMNMDIRPDLSRVSSAELRKVNPRKVNITVNFGVRRLTFPDGADFSGINLNGAELAGTDFSRANFTGADFRQARLNGAFLHADILSGADFSGAKLLGVVLSNADCSRANFSGADFFSANLKESDFSRTIFAEANLRGANLTGATFIRADLSRVSLSETVFSNTNLTAVRGLETCDHRGPSALDHRTLARSRPLPLAFLRGCGLPDRLIDYLPSLLDEPFQFYSCFISYASKDHTFAERLHADLQNKGVRCWFAPEDMKIGDRLRPRIDETIRLYDKLLLVLSKTSVASQWVEQEVETALARERQQGTTILFPVRIDNTVMALETGWPALIRNTRNIGDFRRWKTHDVYQKAFDKLLGDLKAAERQPEGSRPVG
jgi:uncharacterized protein YjbI with pentapeptide repeats